jgi:hypothetical protein
MMIKMSETQTLSDKIQKSAKKRLSETKELLKGLLNIEKDLESETENNEKNEMS